MATALGLGAFAFAADGLMGHPVEGGVTAAWGWLQSRPVPAPETPPAAVPPVQVASAPPVPALDPERPPNILFITLCSVRADHVGASGYGAAHTPVLDALAAEGVWFGQAWAPATFTLPSHASMLTGRLPGHVGVMATEDSILASVPTLPEVLKLYGYHTVAYAPVASRASFSAGYGLQRGFDTFLEGSSGTGRPGDVDLPAIEAMAESQPFFGLIHLKEAHPPYGGGSTLEPDPRVREWNDRRDGRGGAGDPDAWMVAQMQADPALRTTVSHLYDQALERVDQHVGAILRAMADRGLLEHTVVVVAGDHGQALGERGHIGHQGLLLPEVLHVPLIVRLPTDADDRAAGLRIDQDVGLIDLLPTLAGLAGATAPQPLDGRSLTPLLHGKDLPMRGVLAQAIVSPEAGQGGLTEVLVRSPWWLEYGVERGTHTLRRQQGAEWIVTEDAAMEASMLEERALRSGQAAASGPAVEVTPAERERLRRDGYW